MCYGWSRLGDSQVNRLAVIENRAAGLIPKQEYRLCLPKIVYRKRVENGRFYWEKRPICLHLQYIAITHRGTAATKTLFP